MHNNTFSKITMNNFLAKHGSTAKKKELKGSKSDTMYITMPSSVKHKWTSCVVDSLVIWNSKATSYQKIRRAPTTLTLMYFPTIKQAIIPDDVYDLPFIKRGSTLELENNIYRYDNNYPYGVFMDQAVIVMAEKIPLNEFTDVGTDFLRRGINNLHRANFIRKMPSEEEVELCIESLKYWQSKKP